MNEKQIKLYQAVQIKNVDISTSDPTVAIISGYASVYRKANGELQVDRDQELVNTDNIDLEDYLKNPVLCYNHNWENVIGKTLTISKDYTGLYITAEVHKITNFEHVFEGVIKGLIKSFSIGFIPKGYTFYDDDTVEIEKSSLIEISLAPVQSNPEALFNVIGTKSLTSVKEIKEQNGLTCDDVACFMSKIKGINMKTEVKTAEVVNDPAPVAEVTPTPEPVATPAPVAEIKTEPVATPAPVEKSEPKVDLATLVQSIAEANIKADEMRQAQIAEVEAQKAQEIKQQEEAKQARITDALAYLKEQATLIADTKPEDLDVDAYEDLYEVVSNVQEALEQKVLAAITANSTAA